MVVDFHQSLCSDDGAGVGGDSGPELGALLGNGTGYSGALHFTLGVDNDTSVVLKVDKDSIRTAPGFALPNNHRRCNCTLSECACE